MNPLSTPNHVPSSNGGCKGALIAGTDPWPRVRTQTVDHERSRQRRATG